MQWCDDTDIPIVFCGKNNTCNFMYVCTLLNLILGFVFLVLRLMMKVTWLGYHFFMIFPTCFSEACVEMQRKMICINEK